MSIWFCVLTPSATTRLLNLWPSITTATINASSGRSICETTDRSILIFEIGRLPR